MSEGKMKACVDCRWFKRRWFKPADLGRCVAPENMVPNLVTGSQSERWLYASNNRIHDSLGRNCGPDAQWFEARR